MAPKHSFSEAGEDNALAPLELELEEVKSPMFEDEEDGGLAAEFGMMDGLDFA